jgi:hypothetical protein
LYLIASQVQQYLPGVDGGSIGAIAIHPMRTFLAVAEKCRFRSPNVYIYSYPDLKLRKVLQNGTERAYRCVCVRECKSVYAYVWLETKITVEKQLHASRNPTKTSHHLLTAIE